MIKMRIVVIEEQAERILRNEYGMLLLLGHFTDTVVCRMGDLMNDARVVSSPV